MKRAIQAKNAPAAVGPYSHAIEANGFIFTSGQLPTEPETGAFPDGGVKAQARQSLENVRAVLEAAGSGLEKAVKLTVFLKNMDDFAAVNEVYAQFFEGGALPARSAVEVARLPKDALLEIECIALA